MYYEYNLNLMEINLNKVQNLPEAVKNEFFFCRNFLFYNVSFRVYLRDIFKESQSDLIPDTAG